MYRSLSFLCLLLFAYAALAGVAVAGSETTDGSGKSGKTTVATPQDTDGSSPVATPAPPARAVAPHGGTVRRWHSLLPGMIR